MKGLPGRMADWPPDAVEEWKERAAIVWASDPGASEADWETAKQAAERIVRERWRRYSFAGGRASG